MTCALYEALSRQGHEVFIVSYFPPKTEEERNDDPHFMVLPSDDVLSEQNYSFLKEILTKNAIQIVVNQTPNRALLSQLWALKQEVGYQVVTVCHTDPQGELKGLIDRYDHIAWQTADVVRRTVRQLLFRVQWPVKSFLRHRKLRKIYQFFVGHSDRYVLLSPSYVQLVKKMLGSKVYRDKVCCIPNFLEDGNLPDAETLSCKKKQVLFVGRMDFQKRLDRMLRIWSRVECSVEDWELIVVGEGDCKEQMESYARHLGLCNCRFVGRVRATDYMQTASAVCLTSSHEGFGMVLLEALRHACVPFAFDSFESARDIIEKDRNGVLVPPFSEEEYAAQLVKFMQDEALQQRMFRYIVDHPSERFTQTIVVEQWQRLFGELAKL